MNQLENINIAEYLDSNDSAETIPNLLLQNSVSLTKKNFKTNKKNKSFVRLPEDVKVARYHGNVTFDDWKQLNFPLECDAHAIYHVKRKDYCSKLRDFLNHLEADKIKHLCNAADCNEKLFWKLLKGQKSFSKMSASLVNGNLLTDRNVIQDSGQTTLKRWVLLKTSILTTLFSVALFLVFVMSLTLAQITPLGYYVSL